MIASGDHGFDNPSGLSFTPELGYEWRLTRGWRFAASLSVSFSRLTTGEQSFSPESARVTLPALTLVLNYN
jgi:hypothetical protein